MSTNFYWHVNGVQAVVFPTGESMETDLSMDDPRWHIGKRSAAGLYCWNCDRTLCMEGAERIHYGNTRWYARCPSCSQEPDGSDGLKRGPAAVELGFAQPESTRPAGVTGASSFSWAQEPERVGAICEQRADQPLIEDEYGRVLSGREFLTMLTANCPIQFTNSIGREFS